MIRNTILTATLGAFLLMGATCSTDPLDLIKQVQQATAQACGYLPTIETVLALFQVQHSEDVTAIAGLVCKAVSSSTPQATRRGAPAPQVWGTVNGVEIKGWWVK